MRCVRALACRHRSVCGNALSHNYGGTRYRLYTLIKGKTLRLTKTQVTEFQSIIDSAEFEVSEITCLVGKNEAGKSALLKALYRLNPIRSEDANYSVTDDYPRWDVEDYNDEVERKKRAPATVVRATFELDNNEVNAIEDIVGRGNLRSRSLVLTKGYENIVRASLDIDVTAALRHLVAVRQLEPSLSQSLSQCTAVSELAKVLGDAEETDAVKKLAAQIAAIQKAGSVTRYVYQKTVETCVPKFLYFDEYYMLAGCANIEALQERITNEETLKSDAPLIGLINLARLKLDDMLSSARTRELKNKLEGAGNHLTKNVVKYWSQNRYLELRFDVRPARPADPEGMRSGANIWGDVYDRKHGVTTELGTRSRGFVWFFSFLAWYADVKRAGDNVILLLDEPGLTLHAKAQQDLLRYFEAEVRGVHQLIYSTHSPFMIDATRFDRVRIVQDRSIDSEDELPREQQGTKVLTDVLEASTDSLFPLQGALGYEIHQALFIGPHSLVVEGVSDLLFSQTMSALLQGQSREGLDSRWVITPVGGSDKVSTFVSLIGAQKGLNVAVLIDYQKKDKQTIDNLYKKKLLEKKRVVTFAEIVGAVEADIEDMFSPAFYLQLVNSAYEKHLAKPITEDDLTSRAPRITVSLEQYFAEHPMNGNSYNHYAPARYFAENSAELVKKLDSTTFDRFEAAFKRVNGLLM